MIEGMDADTVQIVSENELKALKTYVEKNKLKVDMDSLENGTGVMIIHDHKLSQKQEKQAEKAVGETVCLSPLKNKEACIRWNSMTDKERDKEDEIIKAETPSTEYTLSGYLDNQADGFPEIHQTWHGAEGDIYYLVSEKGFNRLSTKRKTFCMELNVEKKKEKKIMHEINPEDSFGRKPAAEKQYTDKPGRRRGSRHFLHCKIRSYEEKCRLHSWKQDYVRKYQCNIIVCRTG